MEKFVKTIVPQEDYKEITKIGEQYIVHLRGERKGDMIECYECTTVIEPDIEEISSELDEYLQGLEPRRLQRAKTLKIAELEVYNKSEAVDSFTIGGKVMWLDHDLRQQLRISLDAMQQAGREVVKKWFNGEPFEFSIDVWYYMLGQVEVYASDALNVTESHKAAINALESIEDVEGYNFQSGYPPKLSF